MSSRLDHFLEDFSKLQMLEDRLIDTLKQRTIASKAGENTGKFDYMLRNDGDQARDEVTMMEKLAYIYEFEHHKHPELS